MQVLIKSMDNPLPMTEGAQTPTMTRFDVEFETETCLGKAYLFVLHTSAQLALAKLRQRFVGRTVEAWASAEKVYDFTPLTCEGHERATPLGKVGDFAFEGRIVQHYFTGEGSFFEAGDIGFLIRVDQLPADSLVLCHS